MTRNTLDPPHLRLHDLAGFTHFVTSRQGLFAVSETAVAPIADGAYFGLTVRPGALYIFQHCDDAYATTNRGRILRVTLDDRHLRALRIHILADGLDNGCHQIDFIAGRLYVVDTYNQCLRIFDPDFSLFDTRSPLPSVTRLAPDTTYAHMNSIIGRGEHIYVLLHKGGITPSEILCLSAGMTVANRIPLRGRGCHNIAVLEDGEILCCGSLDGTLITASGLEIPIVPRLMTRGLSVGERRIAAGSSLFGPRKTRAMLPGVISFLTRDYQIVAQVGLPASPTDIRRIDGCDLSLTTPFSLAASERL